jgi:serine/threonine protein kinase/Tol biopolymer transport system component
MTPERLREIERLFHEARERPVAERDAFLAHACAGDSTLRREVESLLAQPPAGMIDAPVDAVVAQLVSPASALLTGRRLGVFEVQGLLGVGGMGEVYRARDTRLGREVAIKILPHAFRDDSDRLARFEREARVLASLNHPHIAAIYGLEDVSGGKALVMELVEGEDLSQKIEGLRAKGSGLPLDEALPLAKQIAEALEAAHEQGIIHRDLKPANIKVRTDGTVKVLDFGLAKAFDPPGSPRPGATTSPTLSLQATQAGMILGTAAYMAPEQARGKVVDTRADIWAFGCVLYEMVTGARAFKSDDVTDTIVAILSREPDWQKIPVTASAVRPLLVRCLKKDPKQRLQAIGDARIEIDEIREAPQADRDRVSPVHRPGNRWLLATGLLLVTVIAAVQSVRLWRQSPAAPFAPEARLEIATPLAPGGGIAGRPVQPAVAISPDGLKIVFSAYLDGRLVLWLRSIESVTAHPLAGTDTAVLPFWSPDSRSVGFFADSQLKRIDIDGGTIRTLTRATFGLGGAWNSDGTILFTPLFSGPIYRISAAGGEATVVTQLASGQVSHWYPRFLPDGRHFLYVVAGRTDANAIYVGDLDGSKPRRLVDAELADVHLSSNRLLFVRQGTLFSQPFDVSALTLTGSPAPLAEQVATVSASRAGPVLYRTTPRPGRRQLVWLDRSGKEISRVGSPDGSRMPEGSDTDIAISPDGRYVALSRMVDQNHDIWLLETARGVLSRFTFDTAAEYSARWSPDGRRVVFTSDRNGVFDLYVKPASGAGSEELLLATPVNKSPIDWSPDGRVLLFRSTDPVTSHDLWALPLYGDRQPFPVARTNFIEAFAQFSPDGRWLAYQSNESGRTEVYAQPFPGPGAKLQISTNGGAQMRWRRDGRELFYLGLDSRLMAVPIRKADTGEGLIAGEPMPLFTAHVGDIVPLQSGYSISYIISPDGQRFLMDTIVEEPAAAPITVILNWKPGS